LYPPLEVSWQFAAQGGFYAAPTVVDGTLYAGALNHFVYALDAATGELIWRFETGDQVYAGVAVAGGMAYAASADKTLYALDAATGKLKWKKELDGVLYATPVVAEGLVFLGTGETGTLYALDAATGEERWTFPMGDRLGSGLAVANGRVYAGSYDHRLYALEAATGRLRWQFAAAGIVDSIPLVANGMVYVKLPDDTVAEVQAVQNLGKRLRGFVVWESNRTGQWELYRINTDGIGFRQLTRLSKPNDPLAYRAYLRPRISPDGRWVLFAYGRERAPVGVWVVPAEGGEARQLAVGTPLNWSPDGREVFFVRDSQVWRYELATGREALLHPVKVPVTGQEGGMVGSVSPDLKAAVCRSPRANEYFVFDRGQTLKTMGGCEPGFTADGRYLYWVQGPKDFRIWDIAHNREWQILGQPPTNPHNYTYCPTISADGHWLLYGASPNQHDHDTSDYEIFIVELQDWRAVGQPVRLSWHPRTDRWPALWVER